LAAAVLAASTVAPSAIAAQAGCRGQGSIKKLNCRRVEAESSIRITALDQGGKPAEGLWIDVKSKKFGREQSIQIDASGEGKLWVGRDRSYEIQAYGHPYGYLTLGGVQVSLSCELQIRVVVCRSPESPGIIY